MIVITAAIVKAAEYAMSLGADLATLAADQSEWSQKTFGSDDARGPVGALCHLEREAVEAIAAWNGRPFDAAAFREELADCLLLLLDAARRGGTQPADLIRAAAEKMVKNKARTWPKTTGDVPTEHIREA